MRKVLFLSLILLTWYLAGMYQYFILLVLFGVELLILPAGIFMSRYFRTRTSADFFQVSETTEVDVDTKCYIKCRYIGRRQVNRLRVRLKIGYQNDKKQYVKRLYGGSRGEDACEGTGISDGEIGFIITPPYCGIIEIHMIDIRVYDYLGLFSAKKVQDNLMKIAVFPNGEFIGLSQAPIYYNEESGSYNDRRNYSGETDNEIKQLREYRAGDAKRRIHWNLSARTGEIWVKELELLPNDAVEIAIDTAGFGKAEIKELSSFYVLLSALVLGILKSKSMARVHWYDCAVDGAVSGEVTDKSSCNEMLLRLYQTNWQAESSQELLPECLFRLNLELELFIKDELIYEKNKV